MNNTINTTKTESVAFGMNLKTGDISNYKAKRRIDKFIKKYSKELKLKAPLDKDVIVFSKPSADGSSSLAFSVKNPNPEKGGPETFITPGFYYIKRNNTAKFKGLEQELISQAGHLSRQYKQVEKLQSML